MPDWALGQKKGTTQESILTWEILVPFLHQHIVHRLSAHSGRTGTGIAPDWLKSSGRCKWCGRIGTCQGGISSQRNSIPGQWSQWLALGGSGESLLAAGGTQETKDTVQVTGDALQWLSQILDLVKGRKLDIRFQVSCCEKEGMEGKNYWLFTWQKIQR